MKKLLMFAGCASAALMLTAQDAAGDGKNEQGQYQTKAEVREESAMWPAFLAFCEFPNSPDVIGLRFTIPFSTVQENVTGIDIGLWGRSMYFEGLQFNVLRNDVIDAAAGFQFGLYNSIGRGDMMGIQAGLWNEAQSFRGVQCGLVNTVGEGEGLQVGLINRAETLSGYQVGLINVIRDAELAFFPVINIGF